MTETASQRLHERRGATSQAQAGPRADIPRPSSLGPGPSRDWAEIATAGGALLAAAIGATVVVGWNIGSETLIAVRTQFIPVQYNTALAFLGCALAVLALLRDRRWLATVAVALTAAIAGLTAIEYLASADLRLDMFFFAGRVGDNISGRPAPNTVVGLLCLSGGVLLLAWRHRVPRAVDLAGSLATIVVAVGGVALAGYLTGMPPAYQWRGQKPIAPLTTVAFLALASGVLALPWRHRTDRRGQSPPALFAPVFVLLLAICAIIAKTMWDSSRIAALPQARQSLVFATVLILVFGVAVATALAGVVRLAQSEQRHSRHLELLNSALAMSEERYRSLTIATAQVIWTTDANGMVCGDMPMWREYTGATREQLQGWGWLDSLHPDDREAAARTWSDALARRACYETEYRLRRRDGEYRQVWARGVPVLEAAGAIREWVGTCTDITERKLAEQQLQRAALYTRSLLEASLDPLVTISREGTITDVNQAAEAATGVARAALIGTDFCSYFTEPERAREAYQRAYAAGMVKDYPLTIRHVAGRTTEVLYNASVYRDASGEVEGVFAAARDITDRKRAEQQLQRYAEELQRSNGELQEFAFVASHDLQEPLRKITAFSERLRDRARNLDETSQDYLVRMHNAAGRMAHLIDSLLDYSRVSTRAAPFEEVDVAELMLGVLADLEQRRRETTASVRVASLPRVMGDPTQLRQLLQNLVGNALKFHPPGRPPQVSISAARVGDRWEISCADHGIGFDPAYADRIFRPFQRLHGRNEYEGSGMGLAICRKIAQRHGAPIAVHSAPGQGATFTVSLPAVVERNDPCLEPQFASSSPKMMTTTTC